MPNVTFQAAAITKLFWTGFKSVVTTKHLAVQYDDDGTVYTVYAIDGGSVYTCTIWKGTLPDMIVSSGYTQSQNDSDKSDFTTNYQSTANAAIVPTTTVGMGLPTNASLVGASDGVDLQTLLVESSTNKNLRVGLYQGSSEADVSLDGRLRVEPTPTAILYDSFDAAYQGNAFNQTMWTKGASGGSFTNNSGYLSLSDGSSPGTAIGLTSINNTITGKGQPFTADFVMKMATAPISQHTMVWGWGKTGTVGISGSLPTTEGAIFYCDAAGVFSASIVSGGTRTVVKTITFPSDGYFHKYRIVKNPDNVNWYMDDMINPVATLSLPTSPFPMYGTGGVFFQTDNVVSGSANTLSIAAVAVYVPGGESQMDAIYPQRRSRIDTVGSLLTTDWEHAGLQGTLPGVRHITVSGYVTTSAITTTAIRATAWTQVITAASTFHVVSSSSSDVNGGVGAQVVEVWWWDSSGTLNVTTVLMNGTTTVVVTMTNCIIIEKMIVQSFGTSGPNVGTISIKNSGDTTTYASIAAGDGQTQLALALVKPTTTIPTGTGLLSTSSNFLGLVKRIRVSANGASGYVFLRADNAITPSGNVAGTLKPITDQIRVITGQPTLTIDYGPGLPIYSPNISIGYPIPIQAYVTPDSTTSTKWWISFDLLEVSL